MQELTVRQYANKKKIALQTAYRRIYEGRVNAHQVMGSYWVVTLEEDLKPTANQPAPDAVVNA